MSDKPQVSSQNVEVSPNVQVQAGRYTANVTGDVIVHEERPPPPPPPPVPPIIAAVADTAVQSLGSASTLSMASVYTTMAHSIGVVLEQAVQANQELTTVSEAIANRGLTLIYGLSRGPTAADGSGVPIGRRLRLRGRRAGP